MFKRNLVLITFIIFIFQVSFAQESKIEMPLLEESVSDFSLVDNSGNQVVLSDLKGKNVMLVFPRGMVSDDHWCQICHYQYAELSKLEEDLKIKKKYNLEVLFVLPYSADSVKLWVDMFPKQMQIIHDWKNPDMTKNDENAMNWSLKTKQILPIDFSSEPGAIDIAFPVLIDSDQKVSKGFKIFDDKKIKAPQNKPAIYILDKEGVLKFKYVSQNTFDRPSYDYLFEIIKKIVD